jgi:hypothetical protein
MKPGAQTAKQGARAIALLVLATLSPAFADDTSKKEPPPPAKSETPAAPAKPADKAPNFTLPNAQDGMTRVKWPREKAAFVTFGEQASQAATQAWTGKMRATYGDKLDFVPVAWLARLPEELHTAAAAVIKASYPDVLMDKSGSCAQRYECKPGQVNAYVIAPDGTILKRIHEPMTDELFGEVAKLVEPFIKK